MQCARLEGSNWERIGTQRGGQGTGITQMNTRYWNNKRKSKLKRKCIRDCIRKEKNK
jgi:hypothetical protein